MTGPKGRRLAAHPRVLHSGGTGGHPGRRAADRNFNSKRRLYGYIRTLYQICHAERHGHCHSGHLCECAPFRRQADGGAGAGGLWRGGAGAYAGGERGGSSRRRVCGYGSSGGGSLRPCGRISTPGTPGGRPRISGCTSRWRAPSGRLWRPCVWREVHCDGEQAV